jgi:hypothetical protein
MEVESRLIVPGANDGHHDKLKFVGHKKHANQI